MDLEFIERIKKIFELSGKVAIVTGAAGGLGKIITYSLIAFGAQVVLASRNFEKLRQLEDEVKGLGGEAFAISADITKEDEVDRVVDETMRRFGKIDILINNSALNYRILAEEISSKNWREVIETNITGAFLCSQKVARAAMIPRKGGKIINLSSIRGRFGRPKDFVAYCTSKGGLDSLTRALACEWGKYNIQVNSIAPSLVETSRDGTMGSPVADPDYTRRLLERIPLNRWGQPEDLVGAVVFLSSDASNFINGHILYVDGGYVVSA
ncbi:MAG: glucose 1-dehydrogenase [Thermodesulfobacteriota bacterium]|nr:glucose 1-dehydrogenase [Thermodesulfobacteriota bacterium]